jgi:translation initiation factor 1 (eIF-1/SUI1)
LTTVQGLPKKFDQKKILKVIKKKFGMSTRLAIFYDVLTERAACNGTIVNDTEMGEVIQLQGDQRKDVQEFLVDKKEGLELDAKSIKVRFFFFFLSLSILMLIYVVGPRVLKLKMPCRSGPLQQVMHLSVRAVFLTVTNHRFVTCACVDITPLWYGQDISSALDGVLFTEP